MKHRTRLLETLRLHFEENLSRVEAGGHLSIPKSTACDLFIRFRKAWLSWPLHSTLSEQKLDECLYRQYTIAPLVPEVMAETPAVRKRNRRPNFPREFKVALIEKSLQPGANMAQLAHEHNPNDNLLLNWRHIYRKGQLLPQNGEPVLLPVTLSPEPPPPFRLPYLTTCLVTHCAANWFFLPGPYG